MFAPKRRTEYTTLRPGSKEHQDFYSRFAAAAYGRQVDVHPDYVLDPELSNRMRRVYHNPNTNHVIIANRGTIPSEASDLRVDAMLALGITEQGRFRDAVAHAKRTQAKYGPDANYTAVGHSLAGSISKHLSEKTGMPAVTFSAHLPYSRVNRRTMTNLFSRQPRNQTNYATLIDPVAVFQNAALDTDFIVKQRKLDPHALANFSDFEPITPGPPQPSAEAMAKGAMEALRPVYSIA